MSKAGNSKPQGENSAGATQPKDRTEHEAARGRKKAAKPAKKMPPSLSKHISRRELSEAELEAAFYELHKGSDRVAAIIGAALVEHELQEAIKCALVDSSDLKSLFVDQGAPFGTFKSKIVAGSALGLYNKKVEYDLEVIRDIRNQFAHALLVVTFENNHIAEACENLNKHIYHFDPENRVKGPRFFFERACWSISMGLIIKSGQVLENKMKSLANLTLKSWNEAFDEPSTNALIAASFKQQIRKS